MFIGSIFLSMNSYSKNLKILGRWKTELECENDSSNSRHFATSFKKYLLHSPKKKIYHSYMQFNTSSWWHRALTYFAPECTDVPTEKLRMEGKFRIFRKKRSTQIKNINLHLNRYYLTLLDPMTVIIYNEEGFCGITDWEVKVERELEYCFGQNDAIYQIFKVAKKRGKERLFFGNVTDHKDTSSPDRRPSYINYAIEYPRIF